MKQRILAGLAALAMASCSITTALPATAGILVLAEEPNTCGENLTWNLDADGNLTISGTGTMAFEGEAPWGMEIRSVVMEEGVTSICHGAFDNCADLTSVSLPSTLKEIDSEAFYACSSLKAIVIPDSVERIGYAAFAGCTNLADITIAESTWIDGKVFADTAWLAAQKAESPLVILNHIVLDGEDCEGSVTIPDGTVEIAMQAFEWNEKMTDVTLPESLAEINGYGLTDCSALTSVTILNPYCVFSLNDTISNRTDNELEQIVYDGVIRGYSPSTAQYYAEDNGYRFESIGDMTFEPVSGSWDESISYSLDAEGTLTISGTGELPEYGLKDEPWFKFIKAVVIGEEITSVGSYDFEDCKALASVTLPESLVTIGSSAFDGCTALTTLNIPENVSYFGSNAFQNTLWLEAQQQENPLVTVNGILIDGHAFAEESLTIPDGVQQIANCAFDDTHVKDVTIPASVEKIGSYAFARCPELASVTILNPQCDLYYTSSYQSLFYNEVVDGSLVYNGVIRGYDKSTAESLAKTFDLTFESLGQMPIAGAHGTCGEQLKWSIDENGTLTISGTGEMEWYNGYNCIFPSWNFYADYIKAVVIEEGVTSIDSEAFLSLTNAADFTIAKSVTDIGRGAFYQTPWLQEQLKEPDTFVIVNDILVGCSAKGDVGIPDTVKSIRTTFGDEVTTIKLPYGMTAVEAYAFAGCHAKEVFLPDTVRTIGEDAFDWSEIERITLPASVTEIGADAFRNCQKLKTVTIANPDCKIFDAGSVICTQELWNDDYTEIVENTFDGVIEGYAGSTAEAYAKKYGYTFKELGVPTTVEIDPTAEYPTEQPTETPTEATDSTEAPDPTEAPSEAPTEAPDPTEAPSEAPTEATDPTEVPSEAPTEATDPTEEPTEAPTEATEPNDATEPADVTWNLDAEGTLTISGTGEMTGFKDTTAPWADSADKIKEIVIADGVTAIGEGAFAGCAALTSVTLPESLTDIGPEAFAGCLNLTEIVIPEKVRSLGKAAFLNCEMLDTITILNPDCEIFDAADTICSSSIEHELYGAVFTGTIVGYEGSTAQQYAQKYKRSFRGLSAAPASALGDVDESGTVNASDAARILIAAAAIGGGMDSGLTQAQQKAADVNSDGKVNASDAAIVLQYAAAVGAGHTDAKITDFIH